MSVKRYFLKEDFFYKSYRREPLFEKGEEIHPYAGDDERHLVDLSEHYGDGGEERTVAVPSEQVRVEDDVFTTQTL